MSGSKLAIRQLLAHHKLYHLHKSNTLTYRIIFIL